MPRHQPRIAAALSWRGCPLALPTPSLETLWIVLKGLGRGPTLARFRQHNLAAIAHGWGGAAVLRVGQRRTADIVAALVLVLLTASVAWPVLKRGTVIGLDTATFFYPMYHFLGERLRSGDIPGWNPHQFSGTPFAADPESGWTYLPAMLSFSLLSLSTAAAVYILAHITLAGLATYALARSLGLAVGGALLAGAAYGSSAFVYEHITGFPVHAQAGAWLPVILLGVERAVRAGGWLDRVGAWGIAGLGISQVLAAWLGQGIYYALLAMGGFLAYRTLLAPPIHVPSLWHRLCSLALHGTGVLLFGFALGAAGVLPRLEYNQLSTLPGGRYQGASAWAAAIGGWTWPQVQDELFGYTGYYLGGATFALALAGFVLSRTQFAAPYFAALSVLALILLRPDPTPLHQILFRVLPRFEEINRHSPQRVMFIFYLGPALLAGAAVAEAVRQRMRLQVLTAAMTLPALAALWLHSQGAPFGPSTVAAIAGAILVLASCALPLPRQSIVVPVLLVLLMLSEFVAVHTRILSPDRGFHKVDLEAYYTPTGAGAFLRDQQAAAPFRFVGYDPRLRELEEGYAPFYRYIQMFGDPRLARILVNNRATLLELDDAQGYNPVQLARYADYIAALNGRAQDYHEANVFPEGLASPLLDLLNVRYVVVPAELPTAQVESQLGPGARAAYGDTDVRVVENPEVLPRVWVVHEARQVATPAEALALLASGAVDPRRVALLEEPPPLGLAPPTGPATERATILAYEPDHLHVQTTTTAPGLLVLSETAFPAWRAYIDGEPAPVLTANALLRAVPVPAGMHTVELRFESSTLRLGLVISLISFLGILGVWTAAGWRWGSRLTRATRRGAESCS